MGETAKKAILAVSFGTSHSDTRKVTIDAIEEDLKAAFADCSLYRACDQQNDSCQTGKKRRHSL